MSVLRADYFDGKRDIRHEVSLMFAGGKLKLVGRTVSLEFDARRVRAAPRVANTPRWLYLPGGGACAIADNDAVDRIAHESRFARLLHRFESLPAFAAVAVALVVGVLWLLIDRGVPAVAERVARNIPPAAEAVLGERTLSGMDRYFMHKSKLPPERQALLRDRFGKLVLAAGVVPPPRLEFRASPAIGPNAFALPGGIIVATDELVRLARSDERVLAVLAHELGHVHYRHTMRELLQGSAAALIIAGVTGDIASTTSLAASAPILLLQTKYSRDYEREADRYGIDLLKKTGIGPRRFAEMMARFEKKAGKNATIPGFLSTHPPTEERKALALAEAGGDAGGGEGDDEDLAEMPEPPHLVIIDPEQRQVAALLDKRDYGELERVLGGYQAAFEKDPGSARELESVFRAFAKIQRKSGETLDAWVQASPSSYVARLSRGAFFVAQGLEARGTNFSQDTSEENLDDMREYFKMATADLERSLALTPKPYLSRRYLMTISRYGGSRGAQTAQYQEAAKLAPRSVETRIAYMTTLEPRWGGSVEQMEAFLAESRAALNAGDADRLAARIPAYRGFQSSQKKDYGKAVGYFDTAVRLDDGDAGILCQRSHVLSELKRDKEAFDDVTHALSKARDDRYCIDMAVYLSTRVTDAAEGNRVLDLVIESDPALTTAYNARGWNYDRLHMPELAYPDYLFSAKSGDAWAQYQVGKILWDGAGVARDREQALAWLAKSAGQGNADAVARLAQARKDLGQEPR